jgi:chemotaxis protein MotC
MLDGRAVSAASAALLAVLLAGAGPPPSHPPPDQQAVKAEPLPQRAVPNPIQTVRIFSALQERIVNGSSDALQSQAGLAREIGSRLLRFDPSIWKDPRNREAAIRFTLMGGDPRVIEELEAKRIFEGVEATLAEGAIAFAYGNRKVAEAQLGSVDPRLLSPGLGGYVALIMAVLVGASDPLRALGLCDEARLLSQGTAVEEAALRLSIELAILANQPSRFDSAVIHHLHRFPNSLYAQTIDARIARVLAARKLNPSLEARPLAAIVDEGLSVERRRHLLEELTKAALRSGAAPTAAFAARRLRPLATENSQLADLCRAAEVAHAIFDGRRAEARALLAETERGAPSTEVGALLRELRTLVTMLEAPPAKAHMDAPPQGAALSGGQSNPVPSHFVRYGELAKRVESVLGNTDKLLQKAGS